ncbi:MAG: ACP S-malonyltransferase, partial [Cytophagales bacterium]|nr:ACP S-malonyltransferase [Cytophagales bacterium]
MSKVYLFPGQGAQFIGMGKDLYESFPETRKYFDLASTHLGFDIKEKMFSGTEADLKETRLTQPAIFIHSLAKLQTLKDFSPDAVAGHSLGEFSALVAAKAMDFETGLRLVSIRAKGMQEACQAFPSTMAAVLGIEDQVVEKICQEVSEQDEEIV